MADFDFLDGFDAGGDWGFTGVSSKPSDQTVSSAKATEQVVKQTSESVGKAVSGEIISRLETKLDKILREVATSSEKIDAKHEVELEIAKSQMDDLRKDNLGKIQKDKFDKLEKLIIPLLIKLAKSPEAYIHWPNRAEVIEAQVKKIIAITRG
jgi:hypothetical protein